MGKNKVQKISHFWISFHFHNNGLLLAPSLKDNVGPETVLRIRVSIKRLEITHWKTVTSIKVKGLSFVAQRFSFFWTLFAFKNSVLFCMIFKKTMLLTRASLKRRRSITIISTRVLNKIFKWHLCGLIASPITFLFSTVIIAFTGTRRISRGELWNFSYFFC